MQNRGYPSVNNTWMLVPPKERLGRSACKSIEANWPRGLSKWIAFCQKPADFRHFEALKAEIDLERAQFLLTKLNRLSELSESYLTGPFIIVYIWLHHTARVGLDYYTPTLGHTLWAHWTAWFARSAQQHDDSSLAPFYSVPWCHFLLDLPLSYCVGPKHAVLRLMLSIAAETQQCGYLSVPNFSASLALATQIRVALERCPHQVPMLPLENFSGFLARLVQSQAKRLTWSGDAQRLVVALIASIPAWSSASVLKRPSFYYNNKVEDDANLCPSPELSLPHRVRSLIHAVCLHSPLKGDALTSLSQMLPFLANLESFDDVLEWFDKLRLLATSKVHGRPPTLDVTLMRTLIGPLMCQVITTSPDPAMFRRVYEHLNLRSESFSWSAELKLIFNSLNTAPFTEESIASLPLDMLMEANAPLPPGPPSDALAAHLKSQPLDTILSIMSRTSTVIYFKDTSELIKNLFALLRSWSRLLHIPWDDDTYDLENLLLHCFYDLQKVTPDSFVIGDIRNFLVLAGHDLTLLEVVLARILIRIYLSRLSSALDSTEEVFVYSFKLIVATFADPSSLSHIKPGITALLLCQQIMPLLKHFARFSEDGTDLDLNRLLHPEFVKLVPFLKWFKCCLDVDLSKTNKDIRDTLQRSAKESFYHFRHPFVSVFQSAAEMHITIPELKRLLQCMVPDRKARLEELLSYLTLNIDIITDAHNKYLCWRDELELTSNIVAWLESNEIACHTTVRPRSTREEDFYALPISGLSASFNGFRKDLGQLGVNGDLIETLKIVLSPKSKIFQFAFDASKRDHTVPIPFDQLPVLIHSACNYLTNMMSGSKSLSQLTDLWNLSQSLGPDRFKTELNQLQQLIHHSKYAIDAVSMRAHLENGCKLADYRDALGELLQFAQLLPSLAKDLEPLRLLSTAQSTMDLKSTLRDLHTRVSDQDTLLVRDLQSTLASVEKATCGLSSYTLKIFPMLSKYAELVQFLQRPDFTAKLQHINDQLPGITSARTILSNLAVVYEALDFLQGNHADLTSLLRSVACSHLAKASPEELNTLWSRFEACRTQFSAILNYFNGKMVDSAVAMLPTILLALKSGRFVISGSSSTDRDLVLELLDEDGKVDSTLQKHILSDRLRSVRLFTDMTTLKPEEQAAVLDFQECYHTVLAIAEKYYEMFEIGHPRWTCVPCLPSNSGAMTVHGLKSQRSKLSASYNHWLEALEKAQQSCPRLLFLSPTVISQVLHKLNKLFVDFSQSGDRLNREVFDALAPFLVLAFPELSASDAGALPISPNLLSTIFKAGDYEGLLAHFGSSKKTGDTATFRRLLSHFSRMLLDLEKSDATREAIELGAASSPEVPFVVRSRAGQSPAQLWSSVIRFHGAVPHPSLILHGSSEVSSHDLERFISRVMSFPTLAFVLFGVNELLPELRHRMLAWASSHDSMSKKFARLILVFTANRSGEESFNIFPSGTSDDVGSGAPQTPESILASRAICSLSCLHSFQGKTTYSKAALKKEGCDRVIQISIAEKFDADRLLSTIRKVYTGAGLTIGVHINVQPYADLKLASRFLGDWFYFGVIRDYKTGDAFYAVPRTVVDEAASLDTGIDWRFVVELSSPPKKDKEFGRLAHLEGSLPPILEHLPCVYHLLSSASNESSSSTPLVEVGDAERLLAGLIRHHKETRNTREAFVCELSAGNTMTFNEVRQVLNEIWCDIPDLRRRKAMIKLLADECEKLCLWYSNTHSEAAYAILDALKGSEAQDWEKTMNGAWNIFEMLLAQALFFTAGKAHLDLANRVPPRIVVSTRMEPPLHPRTANYLDLMNDRLTQKAWHVVVFGPYDEVFARRCPLKAHFYRHLEDAGERSHQRALMRTSLSNFLGISRTNKMVSMLEQHSYVLTCDLTLKLMHLHARIRAGNNVILMGDTGQGKTQMVVFLSYLLNMNMDAIPDLIEELSELAIRFIHNMYPVSVAGGLVPPSLTEEHKSRVGLIKLLCDMAMAPRPRKALVVEEDQVPPPDPARVAACVHVPAPVPAPAPVHVPAPVPAPAVLVADIPQLYYPDVDRTDLTEGEDADATDCWTDLRATLMTWLQRLLARCPLMEPRAPLEVLIVQHGDAEAPKMKKMELRAFLNKVLDLRPKSLFFKQLMYKGLALETLTDKIRKASNAALQVADQGLKVVLFIDESNTTSFMGRLKELLSDHRWNDSSLPRNLCIVAAANPRKIERITRRHHMPAPVRLQRRIDYSKGHTAQYVATGKSYFDVRPQHESLDRLVFNFADMAESGESEFWECLIELGNSEIHREEELTVINFVLRSQNLLRDASIEQMHLSIRDLVRAMKLFKYFRTSRFGSILVGEASIDGTKTPLPVESSKPFSAHFWKSLFMAIGIGYYLRFENDPVVADHVKPELDTRQYFRDHINGLCQEHRRYFNSEIPTFVKTMDDALDLIFRESEIPPAIAPTTALKENLLSLVVAIDMNMPITISGPAGCSKTLSVTIAAANMQGRASPRPLYRLCTQVHLIRYQCSETSSDAEIAAIYAEAKSRQEGFAGRTASDIRNRCVVFLDELNLAEDSPSHALKAIHGELDGSIVMSVILTNKLPDPAKTNRTVQVRQTQASSSDLSDLVLSCLFNDRRTKNTTYLAISAGICTAYESLSNGTWNVSTNSDRLHHQALSRLETYQLRDFVYFLRCLRNACFDEKAGEFVLRSEELLQAILRNFGGLMYYDDKQRLVNFIFTCINDKLRSTGQLHDVPKVPLTPLDALRSSVLQVIPAHETNPNINSCRFLSVIDATDTGIALDLLFDLNVIQRDKVVVLTCPEFEEDSSERGYIEQIQRCLDAMRMGGTVVLQYADAMNGNLYDLFNKAYSAFPVDNPQPGEPKMNFFTNVAAGASSQLCPVHASFKLVTIQLLSDIPGTPLPFLSRFERQVLTIEHCMIEKRRSYGLYDPQLQASHPQLNALLAGVSDFWKQAKARMPGQHPFHGLVEEQTILSLVMGVLDSSLKGGILDPVPLHHWTRKGSMEDTKAPPARSKASAAWMQHLIKLTNWRLLQVAKPECVAKMSFLPLSYRQEYFLHQEHLSAANLVRGLLPDLDASADPSRPSGILDCISSATSTSLGSGYHNNKSGPVDALLASKAVRNFSAARHLRQTTKFIISTRACSAISRLSVDKELQACLVGASNMEASLFVSGSSLPSLALFSQIMHDFTHPKTSSKRILIVTFDMRITKSNAHVPVTNLRTEADHHLRLMAADQAPRYIFFLLYHPPEHAQSPHYAYPALFWGGWEYYYVDSLGIWTEDDTSDPVYPNAGDKKIAMATVDGREWMAMACGVDTEIRPDTVSTVFRGLFDVEFPALLRVLAMDPIPRLNSYGLSDKVKQIYQSRDARLDALRSLHPSLINAILQDFSRHWSSTLLHDLVKSTCDKILNGKATDSLLHLIRDSLRLVMLSICKNLVTALLTNLNMQPIGVMLAEAKIPDSVELSSLKLQFVKVALRLVESPSVESILAFAERNGTHSANQLVTYKVPHGKLVLTQLPLFDLVVRRISSAVASAMKRAGVSSLGANMTAFIPAFAGELEQCPALLAALKLIDPSTVLRDCFYDDFAKYRLELPELSPSLRHVIRVILDAQVGLLDKQGIQIKAACLFLIPSDFCSVLSHIGLCLASLQPLNIPEEATSHFGEQLNERVETWTLEIVETKVQLLSVDLLWSNLLSCFAEHDHERENVAVQTWIEVFSDLHTRIRSARWLKACSTSNKSLSFYHRMNLFFEVIRAYSLTSAELQKVVQLDKELNPSADSIGLLRSPKLFSYHAALISVRYIEDLVARARYGKSKDELDESQKDNPSPLLPLTTRLAQSLVRSSVTFDPQVHATLLQSETLRRDISMLLHIAARCSPSDHEQPLPNFLFNYFDRQWLLGQLSLLLSQLSAASVRSTSLQSSNHNKSSAHDKSVPWLEELFLLSNAALQLAHDLNPTSIGPFVPLITEELSIDTEETVPKRMHGDLKDHHPSSSLEVIWLKILLKHYSRLTWRELILASANLSGGNRMSQVRRVAVSASLISRLAEALSSPKAHKEASDSWLSSTSIKWAKEHLLPTDWDASSLALFGLPADPVPFFFQQLASYGDSTRFFAQKDLLNDLGLGAWHRNPINDRPVLDPSSFRFMNLNDPPDERYDLYQSLSSYFKSETPSVTGLLSLVASFLAPTTQPPAPAPGAPLPAPVPIALSAAEKACKVWNMRMVLFMAVYQNFLFFGRACPLISDSFAPGEKRLSKMLNLTTQEIGAFKFIAGGPVEEGQANCFVLRCFSQKALDAEGCLGEDAQLLINTMATLLGAPRDSNHLYPLAFEGHILTWHTPMIASTMEVHADCGFSWEQGLTLPHKRSIMGGVTRHRLALNTSYWAAFTWALILDGDRVAPHAMLRSNHVLNYVPEPKNKYSAMDYAFARASVFRDALTNEHPDNASGGTQPLSPLAYCSESLLQMQSILSGPHGDEWRSYYAKDGSIAAYHHVIQRDVYQVVDATFSSRQQTYVRLAAEANSTAQYLATLCDYGPHASLYYLVIPTESTTMDILAETKNGKADAHDGATLQVIDFVSKFLTSRPKLVATRLLPGFVLFYEVLTSACTDRFTQEELKTLTLEDLIIRLEKDALETRDAVARLRELTEHFLIQAAIFKDAHILEDACREGMVQRAFEFEVQDLSWSTPVCYLLNIDLGPGFENHPCDTIRTMSNRLVELHNDIIDARDALPISDAWNFHHTLYKPSPSERVPLAALKHGANLYDASNLVLVTGDLALPAGRSASSSQTSSSAQSYSEIDAFITSHCILEESNIEDDTCDTAIIVDWKRVGEFVAAKHTAGRHQLSALQSVPIRFSTPRSSSAMDISSPNKSNITSINLDYFQELERIASNFHDRFPPSFRHINERSKYKYLRLPEAKLRSFCRHLYYIIYAFLQQTKSYRVPSDADMDLDEPQLPSDGSQSVDDAQCLALAEYDLEYMESRAKLERFEMEGRHHIFTLNGHCWYHLALYVLESYREYGFWFIEPRYALFEADFDDEANAFLSRIDLGTIANPPVVEILEHTGIDEFDSADAQRQRTVENLINFKTQLNDLSVTISSDVFLQQARDYSDKSLRELVKKTRLGEAMPAIIDGIIPESVTLSQLTTFLRKLAFINNQVTTSLNQGLLDTGLQSNADPAEKYVYQEKIPAEFLLDHHSLKHVYVEIASDLIKFDPIDPNPTPLERWMAEMVQHHINPPEAPLLRGRPQHAVTLDYDPVIQPIKSEPVDFEEEEEEEEDDDNDVFDLTHSSILPLSNPSLNRAPIAPTKQEEADDLQKDLIASAQLPMRPFRSSLFNQALPPPSSHSDTKSHSKLAESAAPTTYTSTVRKPNTQLLDTAPSRLSASFAAAPSLPTPQDCDPRVSPEIEAWLSALGPAYLQYGAKFASEAYVSVEQLADLSVDDLKELGVKMAHRKSMLAAILPKSN